MKNSKLKDNWPDGCIEFHDYNKIIEHDINSNRPNNICDVAPERAISHSYVLQKSKIWFCKPTFLVMSTTTYEMSGRCPCCGTHQAWGETDRTGLVWKFSTRSTAMAFYNLLLK